MAPRPRGSAPAWIVTFGDMMALLTTFFILLFSLSELDAKRYHSIAGSLQKAFGNQWVERVQGTDDSIIELRPDGTVEQQHLQPLQSARDRFAEMLSDELSNGLMELELRDGALVLSFRHEAAFESGSAALLPEFKPVMDKAADLLAKAEGEIVVAGHTDSVPISNDRFRSNWDLSAARAVSVVHHLLGRGNVVSARVVVQGHADTQPVAPNATVGGRARNRRVEIRLLSDEDNRINEDRRVGAKPNDDGLQ